MAEKFKVCCDDALYIGGLPFKKSKVSACCDLEFSIPEDVYVHILDEHSVLYAKKAKIGTEPHPFIELCEAAYYIDGAWILGIDQKQNRYFTPVFTNE